MQKLTTEHPFVKDFIGNDSVIKTHELDGKLLTIVSRSNHPEQRGLFMFSPLGETGVKSKVIVHFCDEDIFNQRTSRFFNTQDTSNRF